MMSKLKWENPNINEEYNTSTQPRLRQQYLQHSHLTDTKWSPAETLWVPGYQNSWGQFSSAKGVNSKRDVGHISFSLATPFIPYPFLCLLPLIQRPWLRGSCCETSAIFRQLQEQISLLSQGFCFMSSETPPFCLSLMLGPELSPESLPRCCCCLCLSMALIHFLTNSLLPSDPSRCPLESPSPSPTPTPNKLSTNWLDSDRANLFFYVLT